MERESITEQQYSTSSLWLLLTFAQRPLHCTYSVHPLCSTIPLVRARCLLEDGELAVPCGDSLGGTAR